MAETRVSRVLLVNHVGEISGAENSLLTLARHLDRRRVQPVAAVPPGRLAGELQDLEVPVRLLPALRLSRPPNPWRAIVAFFRMRSWAKALSAAADELAADLVAANSLTAGIAAALGPGRRLPLVWHARDLRAPERTVRWLIPRATRIAAISCCVADHLARTHRQARAKTTMIYNGIDTVLFRPERGRAEVREELGVPEGATVVGTVGQLVPWKRQDLFLEAAAHILAQIPRAWFLVVGADIFGEHPDYVQELQDTAAGLGLAERTVFTGYRRDIASVMAAMDLLVHPNDEEPLGRVVLEAMSLGVPCVAVDRFGPAEIIQDGVSGVLVQPGDAAAMASRAVELLGRAGALARMGEAARSRVEDVFSAERMARLTEDLCEEALAESAP